MITKDQVIKNKARLSDAGFTRCQIDVLCFLVEGRSNREIGNALYVTEKAVKYHVTNLLKKFEVKGRKDIPNKLLEIVED